MEVDKLQASAITLASERSDATLLDLWPIPVLLAVVVASSFVLEWLKRKRALRRRA